MTAAKELKLLTATLTGGTATEFAAALHDWQPFLDERRLHPLTGKSHYVHRRLRSACLSWRRNLPWLFTCQQQPALGIPNTTNAIDGQFADLKNKPRGHNGLTQQRKLKFIKYFLQPTLSSPFVHYAEKRIGWRRGRD
jgi:hypothetical protein